MIILTKKNGVYMRINSINTSFAIAKPKKNRDIKTTSPQKDTFVSSTSFGISNYEKVFFLNTLIAITIFCQQKMLIRLSLNY